MGSSDAPAVVAVEIFVERNALPIVGIRLQLRVLAQDRTIPLAVLEENARQPLGQFGGYFFDGNKMPRSGRAFDFEIIAVIVMKLLQRLDDEKIERKPNGAAPIGIAAELPGCRIRPACSEPIRSHAIEFATR